MSDQAFRSGFVALIGRPNAGKSTLLNQILGQKVAICSDKPQTTRNIIRGIYHGDGIQAVFVDTPGVHRGRYKLDEMMMAAVNESMGDCDVVFYLVDVTEKFGRGEEYILGRLAQLNCPVFLLLNKVDLLPPEQLLPLIDEYARRLAFAEVFPVSAKTGENCERLLKVLADYLPEGPPYYPTDVITDQPEQVFIAELIREQALKLTSQEIPHSVAVTIDAMEERANGLLYVLANIYLERESQKGILIGARGAMIKEIGRRAREEAERLLGCRIYLDLRVKIKKSWKDNERLLKDISQS
ncbi:MAG: GTPase Era [Clostridia bacterium]|nr:GTPase Era [Clostridia bacterium]